MKILIISYKKYFFQGYATLLSLLRLSYHFSLTHSKHSLTIKYLSI